MQILVIGTGVRYLSYFLELDTNNTRAAQRKMIEQRVQTQHMLLQLVGCCWGTPHSFEVFFATLFDIHQGQAWRPAR